jgi:hypothetical protein
MKTIRRNITVIVGISAALLSPAAVDAQGKDSVFTSEQILSYLYKKSFGGVENLVPNVRGTVGAKQSLWQQDKAPASANYVYAEPWKTRLEANIEIEVFNFSYSRNRDKEKNEFRAYVMKHLSQILAAQKLVMVLENSIGTNRKRRGELEKQIEAKIAYRADLAPLEDRMYSLQSQLYEAQSTLEQRVIELAMQAEEDWIEAYRMIIKWDGKLFDQPTTAKGGKK